MDQHQIGILLAQSDPGQTSFWKEMLSVIQGTRLEFITIDQVHLTGRTHADNDPDLLILDLSYYSGNQVNAFLRAQDVAPSIPIIVILESTDRALSIQLVQEGAQDCLARDELDNGSLDRSIHYAIGRQKLLGQLRSYSLVDELTGVYNRRGFLSLWDNQAKLAERTDRDLLLIFADVDDLKYINDTYGHYRGDLALSEAAHIMRETFRETDILARWGGDEFVAALVCKKDMKLDLLIQRFKETLNEHNSYREKQFILSLSIGMTRYDPHMPCHLEELMEKADHQMYENKKTKKPSPVQSG